MKVYTTNQLNAHLNEKGISKLYGDGNRFLNSDYFQVVNAYKALFVLDVENIDKIMTNIDNDKEIDRYKKSFSINKFKDKIELKTKILNKICDKYSINNTVNQIDTLKNLKYIHHIYTPKCTYNDFLRMYDFEHDMRCLLLKYTLKIENNLKRVFIKTLNDTPKMKDSFITDIDSYNTTLKAHNASIRTLKNILDLHNSSHSKPIGRKIKQDIIVPYWILINEMTFGVVINCIKNLKGTYPKTIYENLIEEFTNAKLKFANKTDLNNIEYFKKILDYIGTFRNMLAHNQPIFAYNIKDDSLCNYPVFKYNQPQISGDNIERTMHRLGVTWDDAALKCQQRKNNQMKETCKVLFGEDNFNKNRNLSNMNLSYIIYFIYKINIRVDSNCTMKQELIDLFYSYNVINHADRYHINDLSQFNSLSKKINDLEYSLDYKTIVTSVENKIDQKEIKSNLSSLKNEIKELKKQLNLVNKILIPRKYDKPFNFDSSYIKFTGISANFLKNL